MELANSGKKKLKLLDSDLNAGFPIDRVGSQVDAYESWPDPFISLMPLALELSGRLGLLATRFFELVQDVGRARCGHGPGPVPEANLLDGTST